MPRGRIILAASTSGKSTFCRLTGLAIDGDVIIAAKRWDDGTFGWPKVPHWHSGPRGLLYHSRHWHALVAYARISGRTVLFNGHAWPTDLPVGVVTIAPELRPARIEGRRLDPHHSWKPDAVEVQKNAEALELLAKAYGWPVFHSFEQAVSLLGRGRAPI